MCNLNNVGHMTKMACMPIYGKKPLKVFVSGTSRTDFNQTLHVACGTRVLQCVHK